ncbi:MAG: homoserine O-acetyltransferase MetX [Aggregatilineales bacterium]
MPSNILRDLLPGNSVRMYDPQSVGVVKRKHVDLDVTLHLRCGETMDGFRLAYETYGKLNDDASNAILICHALSGDSHVAGYYTDDPHERPGWWDEAVGPGKMFDTDKFFVICSNVLGGCTGSTSPAYPHPDDKRPYGLRFPVLTIADMVQAQTHLINYLGIDKLFAAAGGSMGGMQALQWAVDYPERVENCLFIASTPISSAQNIAFNEIGRQAIYADPYWNNGDYYDRSRYPDNGLAVARMIGHISYMCEDSLEQKFGRRMQYDNTLNYHFHTDFRVESYLRYQGHKFTKRFDANSYLYITKALDYYDVAQGHENTEAAVERCQCPFLVVSFSSDWLYTREQALILVDALKQVNKDVEYHHVIADFGHDSFLVEVDTMNDIVGGFLKKHSEHLETKAAV